MKNPTAGTDLSGRATSAPKNPPTPGRLADGPHGPEFVAQPDYARIGLDDPESHN